MTDEAETIRSLRWLAKDESGKFSEGDKQVLERAATALAQASPALEAQLAKERRLREEEYQIALHLRQEQHAKLDAAEAERDALLATLKASRKTRAVQHAEVRAVKAEARVKELVEALEAAHALILDMDPIAQDKVLNAIAAALARSRAEGV